MPDAPKLRVARVDLFERPVRLRLPFRFGVMTLTQAPQAFVRVELVDAQGRSSVGAGAEMLVPKWFEKLPDQSHEQDLQHLRTSVHTAAQVVTTLNPDSACGLSLAIDLHTTQFLHGQMQPLAAHYGPALLARAIADGVCRHLAVPFAQALQRDSLGLAAALKAHAVAPDLHDFDWATWLRQRSLPASIALRHTVGAVDALTEPPADAPDDDLPSTLVGVMQHMAPKWLKIKLTGDVEFDQQRLEHIARVPGAERCQITLDGNEQFANVQAVSAFWAELQGSPQLRALLARVAWIEQPIHRQSALTSRVDTPGLPPLVMDESDADWGSWPQAQALGYRGVSSKCCKGLYKSLVNAARIDRHNQSKPSQSCVLSAEDLTTQAGLGVQQDLCLVGLLGATHIERNGHHYVDGFGSAPADEARAFARTHADLYTPADRPRLYCVAGQISLKTIGAAPGFASAAHPDWSSLAAMPVSASASSTPTLARTL